MDSILMTACIILGSQTLFYLIALKLKNNGVADMGWGTGFILIALGQMMLHWPPAPIHGIFAALIFLWGLRLIFHLLPRVRSGREDWRYAEMRERWGASARWKSYTHVFLFQGLLLGIIALPIVFVFQDAFRRPGLLDYIGAAVFLFGLVFESIADRQLARFIRTEKSETSRIMTKGLWRCSRHPNYFGEAVLWWGLFLIAVSAPGGWMAVVSPALITLLLVKVSGVPLLEKRYADDPAFQAYRKQTSVFIPCFPKKCGRS